MILQLTPVLLGTFTYIYVHYIFVSYFSGMCIYYHRKYGVFIYSITRLIGSSRLRWTKRIEWFYGPRWMRTTLGRWPRMSSRRGNRESVRGVGGFGRFRSVISQGGTWPEHVCFWIMSSFHTKDGEAGVHSMIIPTWDSSRRKSWTLTLLPPNMQKRWQQYRHMVVFFLRGCVLWGSQSIG